MENPYTGRTPYELNSIVIPALTLESGEVLKEVELVYERTGRKGGPVVLICHALTGNHLVKGTVGNEGWWDRLLGPGSYLDTDQYNVISFNVLGGNDGSTGPASIDPSTGEPYGRNFPRITVRDMVNAQYLALKELSITHLHAVIGGSLGGMQALEWGMMHPASTDKVFALAVTPTLGDYGLAFNHIGITAIESDPDYQKGNYSPGSRLKGLEMARMVGMVTYRTPTLFDDRFKREEAPTCFQVESYLDYQGGKLAKRFDPNSYLTLLKAMNSHDVGRNRSGTLVSLAKNYGTELITIGYEGDLIYDPHKMETFTNEVRRGRHYFISTSFGHDGFLVEFEKWGSIISSHLNDHRTKRVVNA
ncbi:homoserine O-acetyltransferase [Rossellomorea aquimaris]|uniref:homoserine O-acetyltransferase MetX n=1 Tax=Rossellomorea aquimaris TaxID=189382 RepID=UPI001CD7DDD0|nr:homoserine O-acetyltransferase [Rossellomorea aquimaris]MCA1055335.1 homoserine O-acetyltransferase [Rossellomorea aquimaris]